MLAVHRNLSEKTQDILFHAKDVQGEVHDVQVGVEDVQRGVQEVQLSLNASTISKIHNRITLPSGKQLNKLTCLSCRRSVPN